MRVPKTEASAELVVKRSRFLSTARYFDSPEDIKRLVGSIRENHVGCNHVVYAYVVGETSSLFGMSDDHEPKGTAGRPVLEVVKGAGICNLLVTVVRYFGGTKLGTGGLVHAYTKAAQLAIASMETEILLEREHFTLEIPYPFHQGVRRLISETGGNVIGEEFAEAVVLTGDVPEERAEAFVRGLADLSGGALRPRFLSGKQRFVDPSHPG